MTTLRYSIVIYTLIITICSQMNIINTFLIMSSNDHNNNRLNTLPRTNKEIMERKSSSLISKGSSLILPLMMMGSTSNNIPSANADTNNGKEIDSSNLKKEEDNKSFEDTIAKLPLNKDAYTTLGSKDNNLIFCKLLNGMWQVSGAHGFTPNADKAIEKMTYCANEGFTTFDLADHYGPAEDYVGRFRKGTLSSSISNSCQYFTKWVPRPDEVMNRRNVDDAIARSLTRMKTDRLDLLQFHWWDYDDKRYFDAINHLMGIQQDEKINCLGLTNFDTKHMLELIDEGAPIVSNQVSFSILDTRPLKYMANVAEEKNVKLLCYGTLLGGFLSSYWLNKPEPSNESTEMRNVSLRKYFRWIQVWGGWSLFQQLLHTLDLIAVKHNVSISNVAQRWVLDQKAVGGIIVGVRLGYSEHIQDNHKVFGFQLDSDDIASIAEIQKRRRTDLLSVFGDCGGEYRARKA